MIARNRVRQIVDSPLRCDAWECRVSAKLLDFDLWSLTCEQMG